MSIRPEYSTQRRWRHNIAIGSLAIALGVAGVSAVSTVSAATTTVVHRHAGAQQLAELQGPSGVGFGQAVAISGSMAVVGAPGSSTQIGQAYIYAKAHGRWSTKPVATLGDPGGSDSDTFGFSVAISGSTVVIGAPAEFTSQTGDAYIYTRTGGSWPTTPTTVLTGTESADWFGYSVAVSGNVAIVGAVLSSTGSAFVFTKTGAGWSTIPTSSFNGSSGGSQLGYAVAVAGTVGVIGVPLTSGGSSANVVEETQSPGWFETASMNDGGAGGCFGCAVSASGETVVVGAGSLSSAPGGAYVFTKGNTGWPTQPTAVFEAPTTEEGFARAVGISGDVIGVGDSAADATYIYMRSKHGWSVTPAHTLTAGSSNSFGQSVSVSGRTVIVGAGGSAYVFSL